MKTVGIYDAKSRLSELLEEVARGARITITKHGRPVAVISPADSDQILTREEAIEGLKQFRKEHSLGDLKIKDLINEGRKY